MPEQYETKRQYSLKIEKLYQLITQSPDPQTKKSVQPSSRRIVIVTGAGISTAAGVPDFRGPKGIWTLEKKSAAASKKRKRGFKNPNSNNKTDKSAPVSIDFVHAKPTLTHRAITKLVQDGIVRFVVTQNVDGLHKRAGLSRQRYTNLHGCVFTETCEKCQTEYFRDFDVGGMSFQPTGRFCTIDGAPLCDTLLDWEDPLPEDDFERATEECEQADLVLALGTSLRIEPAGNLPSLAKEYVIVNLQETPKDEGAALIIRERSDKVMQDIMAKLGYPPETYEEEFMPPVERQWTPKKIKTEAQCS